MSGGYAVPMRLINTGETRYSAVLEREITPGECFEVDAETGQRLLDQTGFDVVVERSVTPFHVERAVTGPTVTR